MFEVCLVWFISWLRRKRRESGGKRTNLLKHTVCECYNANI